MALLRVNLNLRHAIQVIAPNFFSAVGFAVPQPVIFELIEVFQK